MNDRVKLTDRGGLLRICIQPPILSRSALAALERTLTELASDPDSAPPLVMYSDHKAIFLAGADLSEIATLTWKASAEYARAGRKALSALARYPKPVVAAVNGSCSGGGFDLVLHCDRIVAGPNASFRHPGARRGLVTGWRGSALLPKWLRTAEVRAALLRGESLQAKDFSDSGLIVQSPFRTPVHADDEARRLALLHPTRLRSWRAFRSGGFVDRFRAFVVHNDM
jgi:enoyl-CoA hydratase/carnithine racemase